MTRRWDANLRHTRASRSPWRSFSQSKEHACIVTHSSPLKVTLRGAAHPRFPVRHDEADAELGSEVDALLVDATVADEAAERHREVLGGVLPRRLEHAQRTVSTSAQETASLQQRPVPFASSKQGGICLHRCQCMEAAERGTRPPLCATVNAEHCLLVSARAVLRQCRYQSAEALRSMHMRAHPVADRPDVGVVMEPGPRLDVAQPVKRAPSNPQVRKLSYWADSSAGSAAREGIRVLQALLDGRKQHAQVRCSADSLASKHIHDCWREHDECQMTCDQRIYARANGQQTAHATQHLQSRDRGMHTSRP